MKRVEVVTSGGKLAFDANEAEFFMVPFTDEDGEPVEGGGVISGFKIDTEGLPVSTVWFKLDKIEGILITE